MNRNQRALAQPDRSRLRKMSMMMVIRIQNQITHRKIMRIVQTRPVPGYEQELEARNIASPWRAGRRMRPGRGA